ncbi:DUF3046 domain-containing protein [Calidifontibacter sp. DB0510]|uniref:DUF3046 domain-containing protein n=1 Tax=Metallococcus carri TaxID=1656884 RepID=A0A967B161_9MICO|nr:DUF3046 domain-containing protein [Metallococcus carri]NHN56109.1 DUF3046 domain-containing protein [Metallococcus carri]NOP37434.1 DUF3046 domain-containing protein [Calidifontibacter sp. DB2511S]
MRVSEFWRLVEDEFGDAYGRSLVRDHVIQSLGERTPAQALEAGIAPREVWRALCVDLQVPANRWLGRDLPLREKGAE